MRSMVISLYKNKVNAENVYVSLCPSKMLYAYSTVVKLVQFSFYLSIIQFNSNIFYSLISIHIHKKIHILIYTGKSGTARGAINLAKTTVNVQSPQNITTKKYTTK